jgi:23S rRNA G2445 N2-methylase RlmL
MPKPRPASESLPPFYATVQPGLETIAAEEISTTLGGDIKRTGRGMLVFRLPGIDRSVLDLRTTEDVYLLAWGTDQLSYRAEALERIRQWTARHVDWDRLLQIHHRIRPKPAGKPTFRLVAQMTGTHGYRRIDAGRALARGLQGKLPASWRHVEENAAVEIWLTIHGATAYCGLRLSDRTMRHRTYKQEHIAASLRPTIAAAMARLAEFEPGYVILDPMCGAGTILAETLSTFPGRRQAVTVVGGDLDMTALRAAAANVRPSGHALLARWNATRLPLGDASVNRIISNPPFGKQLSRPSELGGLYRRMVREYDRVLQPAGMAVVLVAEFAPLKTAAQDAGWRLLNSLRIRVLGQSATLAVWRKTAATNLPGSG